MTTAPTPCEAERLARGLEGGGNGYFEWLKPAAAELRRLQAENERLQHLLQCDTPRYCSSVQRCTAGDEHRAELEARKPLPVSVERLGELWASLRSFHGNEPLKCGHVEFARLVEVEYGVLGRIPMREENGGQIDPTLVDKSPNLQEPLVDKTSDLQDRPAPLSDDDRLRLRSDVARAIWDVMREHEDRCDHALEDVDPKHQVWYCADAAIKVVRGLTGGSS